MSRRSTDVLDAVVVGAGPGGLLSAYWLRDRKIALIEKGAKLRKRHCPMTRDCVGCVRCGEIEGVGGAGGWSDGKLCLGPVGIVDDHLDASYEGEASHVAQVFRELLGPSYSDPNDQVGDCALGEGLSQEVTQVANLGTSAVRLAFDRLHEAIRDSGADVVTRDRVLDIEPEEPHLRVFTARGRELLARNVIVATGKCDFALVTRLVERFGLRVAPSKPAVGVRLAVPKEELARMKSFGNNPKFKLHLPNGDNVKTHCFCYGGEVMAYICADYFLVGGRADAERPTPYANANILYRFASESRRGQSVVHDLLARIRKDYPKNVLCQDARSFLDPGREPRPGVVPLCRGAVFAPLTPYYPAFIADGLRRLISSMETQYDLDLDRASVFGPASEWLVDKVIVSPSMETDRKGLFMVGDGAGLTQGIVAAAVTGLRAVRAVRGRC